MGVAIAGMGVAVDGMGVAMAGMGVTIAGMGVVGLRWDVAMRRLDQTNVAIVCVGSVLTVSWGGRCSFFSRDAVEKSNILLTGDSHLHVTAIVSNWGVISGRVLLTLVDEDIDDEDKEEPDHEDELREATIHVLTEVPRREHSSELGLDVGHHLQVARAQEDAAGQTVAEGDSSLEPGAQHHRGVLGEESTGEQGEEHGGQEDDHAEDDLEQCHRLHGDQRFVCLARRKHKEDTESREIFS